MRQLLEKACGAIGGLALFAIMVLTFFDVGGRKFLSQSITGSLEMTEMLMVVVIFSTLPLVSLGEEHVAFGSLDSVWPKWFKRVQRFLVQLICGGALLWVGYLMWVAGVENAASGEVSAQLEIPRAPFLYAMGVFCALAGAVHVALSFTPLPAQGSGGH